MAVAIRCPLRPAFEGDPLINDLEQRIGYRFKDKALLQQALVHASVQRRDQPKSMTDNERLEFLGDRVLGLAVAALLFNRYPDEEEGALARRHAVLVSRDALSMVARNLSLGDDLLLSPGEEESGGRANPSLLADACEAIIGALFLDAGFDIAHDFIVRLWEPLAAANLKPPQDPKTALQEWAQARALPLPIYETIEVSGAPHAPSFLIRVTVQGFPPASAEGTSKRIAERAAATLLLTHLDKEPEPQ